MSFKRTVYSYLLINILKDIPPEWKEDRIMIVSESDPNIDNIFDKTTFESKSNSYKIGVLADSREKGNILLALLRVIIDNHKCGSKAIFNRVAEANEVEIEKLFEFATSVTIEKLSDLEDDKSTIYINDKEPIPVDLGYGTMDYKWKDEIDLWNTERIMEKLKTIT